MFQYTRNFIIYIRYYCRSQWPCGLRRRSTAARLLRLWVRITPGAWMSVYCECCVLSGSGLCDALITRPEESYRLWRVALCDLETSRTRRPWPALGRSATGKKNFVIINYIILNAQIIFLTLGYLYTLRSNKPNVYNCFTLKYISWLAQRTVSLFRVL